jgi:hypothetical protein
MSDLRKAAEMALEALDCLPWQASPIAKEATQALRQALAQPSDSVEQEHLEQYPAGMMTKVNSLSLSYGDKPRALRFAEMLINPIPTTTDAAIALELRRLHEENEALRQALAESANSTTDFVEPKTPVQQEQEAFTLDRGCWERGCCAYDTRDGDGVIVYVDAVNMSQECVDETAKHKHEPEWIEDGFGTMWQKCGKKDCGKFVVKIGKADCWNGDCPELKGKNA